jgi:type III restriction enzyme
MPQDEIKNLIINSPYEEPDGHWHYLRETKQFERREGRRPAGYHYRAGSESSEDPGDFIPLDTVNELRDKVRDWRQRGYPGSTAVTRELLEHWHDESRRPNPFFFCQIEAIETLIWLREAPEAERESVQVPGGPGNFIRRCCKMATGSGKTVVMALLIAWQALNSANHPDDPRYSKNVLIIAPNLTIKEQLKQLKPSADESVYKEFRIIPKSLKKQFYQARVLVQNWHQLNPEPPSPEAKVVKVNEYPESGEAFARRVLGSLDRADDLIVINDEAHHAWRPEGEDTSQQDEEATIWIQALDRIASSMGLKTCYDFSATPYPASKASGDVELFDWIVSDFNLNDAIEAGLVKTPRVVVRDDLVPDAETYKSKLFNLYNQPEVKDDLGRRADPDEPLPELVRNAYYLLGLDWQEKKQAWEEAGYPTPPVMITVANLTNTAARIYNEFVQGKIQIEELGDEERVLHVDSRVLDEAVEENDPRQLRALPTESEALENLSEDMTRKEKAELLRELVNTIGEPDGLGGHIHNVISVGMLSEGWDTNTVTHIMGLRAFSSQLLCEQVVGRGLRRRSYEVDPETGLMTPEYVNVFGIPFTFLPHETHEGSAPVEEEPKTEIRPVPEKVDRELSWPNVTRVERQLQPNLELDMEEIGELTLDATEIPKVAELAPMLEGRPHELNQAKIELKELGAKKRLQRLIFETSREVYERVDPNWKGSKEALLAQMISFVEDFITSERLGVKPEALGKDPELRRAIITLQIRTVVDHLWQGIKEAHTEELIPVVDQDDPVSSTGDMDPWYTTKPTGEAEKSHINRCVLDSGWEMEPAFILDNEDDVRAWVKIDHLGFEIPYTFEGAFHHYRPDFLIELADGRKLILEVKGQKTDKDEAKWEAAREWVEAVSSSDEFGQWDFVVASEPGEIHNILI